MAFKRVVVERFIKPTDTGIRVSLAGGWGNKATNQPKLMIWLTSRHVMSLLGLLEANSKNEPRKIEVCIGEGGHHGLIRIKQAAEDGGVTAESCKWRNDKFGYKIALGYQPMFVKRTEAVQYVQWNEVDEDGDIWVELVLPKWADETKHRSPTLAQGTQTTLIRKESAGPLDPILATEERTALQKSREALRAADAAKLAQQVKERGFTAVQMGDPPAGRREMLQKIGELTKDGRTRENRG
jgi:hypothetical protein